MRKTAFLVSLAALVFLSFISLRINNKSPLAEGPIEVFNSSFDNIDFSSEISSPDAVSNEPAPVSSSAVESASQSSYDRLRSWGLKRNDKNMPPEVDPGAPELLAKYNAYYIGDTSEKVVYLTFDEGYENGYTPRILDTLKRHNVKAAFFITGPYLKEHQDLARRMVEEGHTVGNHTVNHPSLPTLSNEKIEEEVVNLDRVFYEKFGKHMKFLRPPKGEYSERTLDVTSKLGYVNLFWSFAYDDWYTNRQRGSSYAYEKVMNNLHNGAVLLLHAVSKDNADALDSIIKDTKAKGYRFGSIEELIEKEN